TLLNRLLADPGVGRLAVIVNEFGEIGIDGDLIETGEEELIELSSGCICCVVRGDLIRSMRNLLADKPDLDGIVIETTGLANPSPVIQTMVVDQVIGAQCRLDSVLCMVDAVHILDQLADGKDAADQIAFSDHIVLNKVDDSKAEIERIEAEIRSLNPFAPITRTNRANVPLTEVLNRHSFDLDRVEGQLPPEKDADDHAHDHGHSHIDATGITSVSLTCDTPLDAARLEEWLQDLLARRGYDILRTKGVLSVAGEDRKLVLQAVNMMLEGDYVGLWGDAPRQSRLVFIGRNLDREELDAGFQTCRQQMPERAQ
ncbi:MAG TPA: GTP-binding protein, partial [Alphaproteobacteria bacterium]|nr:GTP-binding protein [Alphaproteobacteria bacterium]